MAIKQKDFIKLLECTGWEHQRTAGSHHIYAHPDFLRPVPVAPHAKDFNPIIMDKMLKETGLKDLGYTAKNIESKQKEIKAKGPAIYDGLYNEDLMVPSKKVNTMKTAIQAQALAKSKAIKSQRAGR